MSDSLVGHSIAGGRYEIKGFLGEGRMGRIYTARSADTDKRVAVKVLHPHLLEESEVVARFERELDVTSKIDHPNTIRVFEFGQDDERHFLAMEFLVGDNLDELLEDEGPFAPERVAWVGAQVAAALAAAHAEGVIHRDISPNNIMLIEDGALSDVVKLLDFGLARRQEPPGEEGEEGEHGLTAAGVRIGTPTYMAPEYISDFQLVSASDMYSLGITLYEMLTGKPPFEGRAYEVMDKHVEEEPAPPSQQVDCPDWLEDVIVGLLAKDPAARPGPEAVVAAFEAGVGRSLAYTPSERTAPPMAQSMHADPATQELVLDELPDDIPTEEAPFRTATPAPPARARPPLVTDPPPAPRRWPVVVGLGVLLGVVGLIAFVFVGLGVWMWVAW